MTSRVLLSGHTHHMQLIPEMNFNSIINNTIAIVICSITNIMLLSHSENIYRLFVRCGIAFIMLMLLFAPIRF